MAKFKKDLGMTNGSSIIVDIVGSDLYIPKGIKAQARQIIRRKKQAQQKKENNPSQTGFGDFQKSIPAIAMD